MPRFNLKPYQQECIDVLRDYCEETRRLALSGAPRPERDAFERLTSDIPTQPRYFSPEGFEGTPYVCLRVPTGGGKTLIGAHAVGTIARHLGHADAPLCLWVAPTTTIRDQTLRGLRTREHPYHEALRESLGRPFQVLTLDEAKQSSRSMLAADPVIVVTTIQAYRIDETANRLIYNDNGYLMDHFRDLPAWLRSRLEQVDGRVQMSLANAMKIRRPIVIMDEAHNARTRISFQSLARFGPSAVLELTATPQREHDIAAEEYASNVLYAVSALQLGPNAAGMIKLPIELESRADWLDVLAATIQRRNELAVEARRFEEESGRYIRPIALIQAQAASKSQTTYTADVVKQKLIASDGPFRLLPESVRIVTGDTNEITPDEDLLSPDSPVEYVITVNKLREGWDCPFAYVLGSIGNVATETAVEQLLGRVLRMPHATPTGVFALDRAYAVVQSKDVLQTAAQLRDGLIERCGFDATSAADAFRVRANDDQRTFPAASIPLVAPLNENALPDTVRLKIDYDRENNQVRVHAPLSRTETAALRDATQSDEDRAQVEVFWQRERPAGAVAKRLDEYAKPIPVPQLAVRHGDRLSLFEPEELEAFDWSLDQCDYALDDFDLRWRAGEQVVINVGERGGTHIGAPLPIVLEQSMLLQEDTNWSEAELVRWLNAELHKGQRFLGLTPTQSLAWIRRVIDHLLRGRSADLGVLARKRHELADRLIPRIAEHGRTRVRYAAELLIRGDGKPCLETSPAHAFLMEEHNYTPHHRYNGAFVAAFLRHAFSLIGGMNGPEEECASELDRHPNVNRWIRNPDRASAGGFSLPLSPGRFYPDFICELQDGRVAIVEYKAARWENDPSEVHKKRVGELWASVSNGKAIFVWVVDRNWAALSQLDAVAPS